MTDRKEIADRLRDAASQIEGSDEPVRLRRVALQASMDALEFIDRINNDVPEPWEVTRG